MNITSNRGASLLHRYFDASNVPHVLSVLGPIRVRATALANEEAITVKIQNKSRSLIIADHDVAWSASVS